MLPQRPRRGVVLVKVLIGRGIEEGTYISGGVGGGVDWKGRRKRAAVEEGRDDMIMGLLAKK